MEIKKEMASVSEKLDQRIKWSYPNYTQETRSLFVKNRQFRHFLQSVLELAGDEEVLDVGCGIGALCKLLAPYVKGGGHIIGIDLDPTLVDYGNRHWARRDSIQLEVGDANYIAYPDGSFDVAASMGLFANVSDADRILSEMLRVLRRPGKLLEVHFDMKNFIELPINAASEEFYRGGLKGMEIAGVDLDAVRFIEACKKRDLPLEKFTYTIEYRAEISQAYINLVEDSMRTFVQNEVVLQQALEFYYQFLKLVGWTREKLMEFVKKRYSLEAHLQFLKAHVGEEFYRKTPLNVFRIRLIE